MNARIAMLAATLLAALAAAPDAAAERQVEALYKTARDIHGCSERWATDTTIAQCRAAIAAYRVAEAASDATPDDLQFLAVARLQEQATLAGVLRERSGDRAGARRELDAALAEVEALAPGTTNAFARVQTLDLQRQVALLELDGGSAEKADAAIAEYRMHSQGFFGVLEQLRDNPKGMRQQVANAIDAGNFEIELGEHYAGLLEDNPGADKQALRGRAVEAFERARQWALARANNDWNGFAEKAPAVLFADASLALAKIAHNADDAKALAQYVGESKLIACTDNSTGDRYNDNELGERCVQAMLMERWVTGENQALLRTISEQNDAQMRAVFEALRKKKE